MLFVKETVLASETTKYFSLSAYRKYQWYLKNARKQTNHHGGISDQLPCKSCSQACTVFYPTFFPRCKNTDKQLGEKDLFFYKFPSDLTIFVHVPVTCGWMGRGESIKKSIRLIICLGSDDVNLPC